MIQVCVFEALPRSHDGQFLRGHRHALARFCGGGVQHSEYAHQVSRELLQRNETVPVGVIEPESSEDLLFAGPGAQDREATAEFFEVHHAVVVLVKHVEQGAHQGGVLFRRNLRAPHRHRGVDRLGKATNVDSPFSVYVPRKDLNRLRGKE